MSSIRVLVVDDSAFTRKVLREVLERAPGVEVVGTARDGLDALEKISLLRPDVVTLDLVMPNLDGLGVLRAMDGPDQPRAVVVSVSDAESALGVEALQTGAVAVVHKPTGLATDRLYELSSELVAKVREAAQARASRHLPLEVRPEGGTPRADAGSPLRAERTGLVVVGTSTGGPQALTALLPALPPAMPVPVVVALHIPAGYTDALARRLDEQGGVRVREAADGEVLLAGTAYIAPGGQHLTVSREGEQLVARVGMEPLTAPHRPSVDVLFRSAARALGSRVLGVVLTGMGDDGLEGARSIRAAGGRVLTESASSAVIYGMPRAVQEAGLSTAQHPLGQLPGAIVGML